MAKAIDKLTDALGNLLEKYNLLQEEIRAEHGVEEDDESAEVDTDLLSSMKEAIEIITDEDEYSTEEVAGVLAGMTEALQEIDPDVFDLEDDEEVDEEDEDFDDDLESLDDYDEDDDDDEDLSDDKF